MLLQKAYLLLPLLFAKIQDDVDIFVVTLFVTYSAAIEVLTQIGLQQIIAQKKLFLQKNYESKTLLYSILRIPIIFVILLASFFIFYKETSIFFWQILFLSISSRFFLNPTYYKNTATRNYSENIKCEIVGYLFACLPFYFIRLFEYGLTEALMMAILLYNLFRTIFSYRKHNIKTIFFGNKKNLKFSAKIHWEMLLIWSSNLLIFFSNFADKLLFAFLSPSLFANITILQRFLQVIISEPSLVLGQKLFLDSSYNQKYISPNIALKYFAMFIITVNLLGYALVSFYNSVLDFFIVDFQVFMLALNIAIFGSCSAIFSQLLKSKALNSSVLKGQLYQVCFLPLSIFGLVFYGFTWMLTVNLLALAFSTGYYYQKYKSC